MIDFDLKRLQNTQLEILKEVDRICQKHDIEYFAAWGTVLGAIRHKGFIPWDDDIDIVIKWPDYVKFQEACKMELEEKYFMQTTETDIYAWNPYTKIRINNTTSMDKHLSHLKCHYGICMDVFPIVAIPNSKIAKKKQALLISIYKVLCYIPYILNIHPEDSSSKAKIFKLIPSGVLKKLRKWLIPNKTIEKFKKCLLNSITKYKFEDCEYCGEIISEPGDISIFRKNIYEEHIIVPFEEITIPIPKEYHEYLSKLYGDYMKLPDEAERIGHGEAIVDFEKSYEEYQTFVNS
ncbi:LPS biosynthesis protein [uncultured Clostridium sp.]|uniref:LicD family protein n=1 Tax=uncultured Clostridium sp. TaxID=59620 RepID=UPI000822E6A6|nr:LicD family protein [uncultured Clostridium sp.]SCK04688.1 LPS biosynthesis protein [uncultured Clostridium sp.]